jgi:hypothetical protein
VATKSATGAQAVLLKNPQGDYIQLKNSGTFGTRPGPRRC